MNKKKIYGPLARFLRAGVRPFLHRWDTSGAQKAQPPAVYVVHHRNMSGPVHTLALLPDEPRPWVLHVFLDRHECFAQYYGYTFRKRFGWPAPAAWAAAGVLSLTVPAVVRSFGAIPVYRSLKETRDMMEQSAQALLRGESSAESRNGAKALLEQLGLGKRLDHLPAQLSGGEQQRVALARAFNGRPDVLFADEPTGNLDRQTGDKIADLLFSLNREHGTTLIMVTHDLQLAARCDRCLRLVNGQLQEEA